TICASILCEQEAIRYGHSRVQLHRAVQLLRFDAMCCVVGYCIVYMCRVMVFAAFVCFSTFPSRHLHAKATEAESRRALDIRGARQAQTVVQSSFRRPNRCFPNTSTVRFALSRSTSSLHSLLTNWCCAVLRASLLIAVSNF